jgi:hypothetical protein
MLTYLIISGLCLLMLLHVVRRSWQNALEIHSAADNLDKARGLAAPLQQATKDWARNAFRTAWLETSHPKYCDVG